MDVGDGTAAIVLAAGGGTRFSAPGPKLLAVVDGVPLVARAVGAALDAAIGPVLVVTGAVDLSTALPREARTVHNPRWSEGLATSLQAGLDVARAAGWRAVVVGLGDQPFVPSACWRAVAGAGTPVATATFEGRRSPPVRLDASVWPLLPVTGDEGARVLLRSHPELVREVPCPGQAVDIDTSEDLERWS